MRKLYRTFATNLNLTYTNEQHTSRRDPTFKPDHHCHTLLDDCVPVIVNTSNSNKVVLESTLSHNQINFQRDTNGHNEFYKYVHNNGNMHQIIQYICDVKYSIGYASWIITGDTLSNSSYQGSHGVPPMIAEMTSHRAELYGIYAILQSLHHLEQKHVINRGKIQIVCDNLATLHCSFDFNHRAPVSCRNFDIIWGIQ